MADYDQSVPSLRPKDITLFLSTYPENSSLKYAEMIPLRVLSQVTNDSEGLKLLFNILEKRLISSPNNIEVLKNLFTYFCMDRSPLETHTRLINRNAHCEFTQRYDEEEEEATNNLGNLSNNRLPNNVGPRNENVLSERVVDTVCSWIGHSWKTLARYLVVIQENFIEELDNTGIPIQDKARMMMEEYQRRVHPSDAKDRLLKALKLAKRQDILDELLTEFTR